MSIPFTRNEVSAARADAIRQTICELTDIPGGRLATLEDAPALTEFFLDPSIHSAIYTLPRPLNEETVRAYIADHLAQKQEGVGLLFVQSDEDGRIFGYSDFQFWPQWAAGELGGGMRADRQSKGEGGSGAAARFDWMFNVIGLDLICSTAALDNVRTEKLLTRIGFTRMGETVSTRPDGTTRPSSVWEMTAADWRAFKQE